MLKKMHKPVIEENHKVMGDTKVILIVEHKDGKLQWSWSTSNYADAGEPETLNEAMTSQNVHIWKMSAISKVKLFLSRKAWIPTKKAVVNSCNIKSEQFSVKKGLDSDKDKVRKR